MSEILNSSIEDLNKFLIGKEFTGKIVLTLHCRNGSVGKCTAEAIAKDIDILRGEQHEEKTKNLSQMPGMSSKDSPAGVS